jgi:tetratricopeptide (TPR) repeat protein/DNA-binding NarL/FixJ family response regulator
MMLICKLKAPTFRFLKVKAASYLLAIIISALSFNLVKAQQTLPRSSTAIYNAVFSSDFNSPDSLSGWINQLNQDGNQIKFKTVHVYYLILKNQVDSAKTLLEQLTNTFDQKPASFTKIDYARLYYTWAKYARKVLDEKLCEQYSLKAYNAFKEAGDQLMAGATLQNLGGLMVQLGNLPKALDYTSKALRLKKENATDFIHFQKELSNIAIIYDLMGLFEKSLSYYKEILRLTPNKDLQSFLFTLNNIGVLYENLEQLDSAYYYFDLLEKSAENDPGDMKEMALFGKARILNLRGNFDAAHKLLSQISKQDERYLNYWRAKNYLDMKEVNKALFLARKEYHEEINTINRQHILVELLGLLSNAYTIKKQYDSALFFKKNQYIIADSLFKEDTQRKLTNLYIDIETMDKQIEIDNLNTEKEVNELKNRNLKIIIIFGSFASLMTIVAGVLFYRNRVKKHLLDNTALQFKVEQKSRDLHHQALRMIQINNHLTEIEEQLKKLKKEGAEAPQEIQRLLTTININKTLEKEWENFSDYFSLVHEGFNETIESKFPNLSINEKRLIVLVRMNLTNKEVASLLNIEMSSVKMAKYRLKRKLNLDEEQDLTLFLQNLEVESGTNQTIKEKFI